MARSDITGVLFDALSLAMQAKAGSIDPQDIDEVQACTEQVLTSSHPVTLAINDFATQYQLHAHDYARVTELGDELLRIVELHAMPDAVDAGRSDIYG